MTPSSAIPTPGDDPELLAPFTRWPEGREGVAVSQFQLSGLHCAACAGLIEGAVLGLDGVRKAVVNAASARLALEWEPQRLRLAEVLARIEQAGYGASPDVAASSRALREQERRTALWRVFVAVFLSMQIMMLATPAYVAAPGELAPDLARLLQWGSWVLSLPVLVFSAGPFFSSAWRSLRAGVLGMDVPVALGLAVSFVASSAAVFDPNGPLGSQVYFDSLTMFVALLLLARWLELLARQRAAEELEAAAGRLPQAAERLLPDGGSEFVAPVRLQPGDRVRVAAGEGFAADGVVEAGSSSVNEALLTGESAPVAKAAGAEVVAGSVNLEAPLVMRVSRVGADTTAQGIVALMQQAQSQRLPGPALLDRVASGFTITVLLLAAAAAAVWSQIEPARALWVAVAVLIVTCPCALSLAAPTTWLAASGGLARRGLMLVRLDVLERLPQITTVVFDKTGTLSEDRPVVGALHSQGGSEAALLGQAVGLAMLSRHPSSRALLGVATPAGVWSQVQELPGQGVQAQDAQGQTWRLGAPAWVAELTGCAVPAGCQLLCGRAGQQLGVQLVESPRADAASAVAALRAQGLRVRLLSGDQPAAVAALASAVGIEDWTAQATPALKLEAVRRWQAAGERVLMVGDGINDAPVLAAADVRIVMGQGAMLARAQADALLLSNRLLDLPLARRLAVRSARVLRQNLAWAALYNAACVPLALLGWLPPLAAGVGMAASSLIVVLNAQRLRLNRQADRP